MSHRVMIFCLSALFLQCADMGTEPLPAPLPPPYMDVHELPGVIAVFFVDGTTPQTAEQFVRTLGLSIVLDPQYSPLRGQISVPVGAENQWIDQLRTYAIVLSASRIAVTTTS